MRIQPGHRVRVFVDQDDREFAFGVVDSLPPVPHFAVVLLDGEDEPEAFHLDNLTLEVRGATMNLPQLANTALLRADHDKGAFEQDGATISFRTQLIELTGPDFRAESKGTWFVVDFEGATKAELTQFVNSSPAQFATDLDPDMKETEIVFPTRLIGRSLDYREPLSDPFAFLKPETTQVIKGDSGSAVESNRAATLKLLRDIGL